MPKITLEFDNEQLAKEFVGWYYDGGGCDAFDDALTCRDVVVHPAFCHVGWDRATKTFSHTLRGG